eukprot:m.1638220 g.1638220  ORF g.1638220 m.1638220 type:complete len:528 (-) comp27284_c0_seq1:130-1713(-)
MTRTCFLLCAHIFVLHTPNSIFGHSVSVSRRYGEGDPMKDMMDLMGEMIDSVTNTSNEFSSVGHHILSSIGDMADRIVSTEQLIDDMGTQIGWMADKIVQTEWIVGNMTRTCFCNTTVRLPFVKKVAIHPPTKLNNHERYRRNQENFKFENVHDIPQLVKNSTWDDMIATMEHALSLMNQLSYNVSTLMNDEVDAIGSMADRIVATECLIMQMGAQIGVMADRIVYTEKLMANASEACCKLKLRETILSPPWINVGNETRKYVESSSYPWTASPPCPSVGRAQTTHMRATRRENRKQSVPINRLSIGANVDPFSWVAKQMEDMMNGMMDEMERLMSTMATGILNGTKEIGILADTIVDTEHLINDMGLAIGEMADCIVASEEIGFQLFTKFCPSFKPSHHDPLPNGKCAPITPVHPVNTTVGAYIGIAHQNFNSSADASVLKPNVLANPIGDFTEMLNLCKKMVQMMVSMSKSMTGMTSDVMRSIAQMADRIVQTIGLINGMAAQINTMAGRIVQTEKLLAQIAGEC